jgi:hypothetical protein
MLQAGDGNNAGSPQGKDNYPKDGAHSRGQLCKAGKEGYGGVEDSSGRNPVLHGLFNSPGMLRTESGRFTEFLGARVSEVKVNSNIEEEWLWLVGNATPQISTHSQMPLLKNQVLDRSMRMAWHG